MASDSQPNNTTFNAGEHFQQQLAGKKAIISNHFYARYPEGWKVLVEAFIERIKGYSIEIEHITDEYYQLDVMFNVILSSREIRVWRAIDKLRNDSRRTCSVCGASKGRSNRDLNTLPVTKCGACVRSGRGGTGTWLDKY